MRPPDENIPSEHETNSNKSIVLRLQAALNTGRVDAGLDLFTEPLFTNGQPATRQIIQERRTVLWSALPDIEWTLEEAIGERDWVAVRWTMRGTHTGAYTHPTLGSIAASGHSVVLTVLDQYRIRDGQIAEIWEGRDSFALLQQFGALPR